MKKITIDTVAKHAGVSKGTVSAVINSKTTVLPSTRDAVMATIRELNYRPRAIARNLKREKHRTFGIVVKELDNPFYSVVTLGVKEFAKKKEFRVCGELRRRLSRREEYRGIIFL